MNAPSEEVRSLLARARGGDPEAFGSLVEAYRPRLLERVRIMMGPDARLAAESTDFVQEVMTDLIRRRAATPLENDQTLLRWMTSIARNKIRDALRRRHEQSFSTFFETLGDSRSQKTPSEEVSQREHLDRLAEGLEALESEHRVVIELRALEGFSFREIGNRLDKSEEAARKQFGRAILRLGEVMRPERENR